MKPQDALKIRFDSEAGKNLTFREYFRELLITLWDQSESFSGKRPFGNGAWQFDIYAVLIKNDAIKGTLDKDGYVDRLNTEEAEDYVRSMIGEIFNG